MALLQNKPVIGIVGGIGSGKSTVADLFRQAGCVVVDADRIGHEVLTLPAVKDKLVRRFGREILAADGAIDRAALGKIVFDDPAKLEVLSAIVHTADGGPHRRADRRRPLQDRRPRRRPGRSHPF